MSKEIALFTNEQLVNHYFYLISRKDVQGLLELFADDAAVYEPFSNVKEGLRGKSAIEHLLKVAVMANAGMRKTIEFINKSSEDSITALVTFERGDTIKGKFTFNFVLLDIGRKITMLTIRFSEF
jgi:ketosteroid isomerase-like protein